MEIWKKMWVGVFFSEHSVVLHTVRNWVLDNAV